MKGDDKKIVNKNEIRITGISRSGNHAVINWILGQIKNFRYCFLNCAEPKLNPFRSARPLAPDKGGVYTNIQGFSEANEKQGDLSEKDYLLYSYEDIFLGTLANSKFNQHHDKWVGKSSSKIDVLVIRDPFNLFASRIKAGFLLSDEPHRRGQVSWKVLKRIYKQHAREYLGEKNYLGEKVLINYNRWVTDEDYRKEISKELDFEFSDEGLYEMTKVAGGSSFEGTSISPEELHEKIENRWKTYKDSLEFWELFDQEIAELSLKIFGKTEALEFFENRQNITE